MTDWEAKIDAERARRPKGSNHRCDKCWYWELQHFHKERHADDQVGECHRHAPRMAQLHLGKAVGLIAWSVEEIANVQHDEHFDYCYESVDEIGNWPRTPAFEWCGDFLKREEAKA